MRITLLDRICGLVGSPMTLKLGMSSLCEAPDNLVQREVRDC